MSFLHPGIKPNFAEFTCKLGYTGKWCEQTCEDNPSGKGCYKKVMKACVVNPTLGTFQSLEEADKVCTAVGADYCAGIYDDECDGGASASKLFRLCAPKSLSPVKSKQNPKWTPTLGSKDPLWAKLPKVARAISGVVILWRWRCVVWMCFW